MKPAMSKKATVRIAVVESDPGPEMKGPDVGARRGRIPGFGKSRLRRRKGVVLRQIEAGQALIDLRAEVGQPDS